MNVVLMKGVELVNWELIAQNGNDCRHHELMTVQH